MRAILTAVLIIIACIACYSQETANTSAKPVIQNSITLAGRPLQFIQYKYNKLSTSLQKQSQKLLQNMQRKEAKLRKKLANKDSALAQQLFNNETTAQYQTLQNKLTSSADTSINNPLTQYIPALDSLQTTLAFLKQGNGLPQALPQDKLQQLTTASDKIKELQTRLQHASDVQSFVRERERQLKEKLQNTPLAKQLKGINKQVYYYQQRLSQYKELINDKKKLEQKALQLVRELPAFKTFWQKHSYLSAVSHAG